MLHLHINILEDKIIKNLKGSARIESFEGMEEKHKGLA